MNRQEPSRVMLFDLEKGDQVVIWPGKRVPTPLCGKEKMILKGTNMKIVYNDKAICLGNTVTVGIFYRTT